MRDSRSEPFTAAIIPLVPALLPGSSSLPEGSQFAAACATAKEARVSLETLAQRAGPALPSYLALHHAGFSVPRLSPNERWALTPPFHPCLTLHAFRRRSGFPERCHRAAFRRRSILCGTFRDAVVAATLRRHCNLVPWRYQARYPCHEFP